MMNKKYAEELAEKCGLTVVGYNPGNGVKVRVFEGKGKDWFDSHPIFMTNQKPGAWAKAVNFLEGYEFGLASPRGLTPMVK